MQTKRKSGDDQESLSNEDVQDISGLKLSGSNSSKKIKPGMRTEPLAGGPTKRSKSRGECPKCHSRGVVLAHSSAGDDYFSCIYCGFQAFRAAIESDLDLPLAAELLGRRFDEKAEGDGEDISE